jgi:hypothetical protein
MWWMIPVGIGLAILYDSASKKERVARERWQNKKFTVKNSIEEHQRNIERQIARKQSDYNYQYLKDLHFSSVTTANAAYNLLKDARSSIKGINRMLKEAREQRENLQVVLGCAKKSKNKKVIFETIEQLKILNKMGQSIFDDRETIFDEQDSLAKKVENFNNYTRELKECIRDQCGWRGQKWYARLEERTFARRLKQEFQKIL